MSYQIVNLPAKTAYAHVIDVLDNTLYELRNVELGGNLTLIKCTLNPFNCQIFDSGIPVPSTDGHYNPWAMLTDDQYVYSLVSRWSALTIYRFSKTTGAGTEMGTVAPAGHTDLNYFQMIKVREDRYYAIARTGGGRTTTLFAFDGQPAELTNPNKWSKIGNVHNDEGVGPSMCQEGGINFTYAELHQYKHYVAIHSWTRCPPSPYLLSRSVLVLYDTIKEKLYNIRLEEVPFNQSTLSDSIAVDVTNPVTTAYRRDIGVAGAQFMITPSGRIILMYYYRDAAGNELAKGLAKGTFGIQQLTFVDLGQTVQPIGETKNNKIILYVHEPVKKYALYDPATDSLTDIVLTNETPGFTHRIKTFCRTSEFLVPCLYAWAFDSERVILPPGYPDTSGLELVNTIDVTSPSANTIRVQASFVRAVDDVELAIYNTVTGSKVIEDYSPGPLTAIDRTYDVPPGKYRAVVYGWKD